MSLSAPVRDDTGTVIRVVSSRILLATLAESLVLRGHGYESLAQSPVSLTLVTREGMELAKTGMPGTPNETPLELLRHDSPETPLATVTSAGFSTYPGLGWRMIAYPPKERSQHPEVIGGSVGLVVLLSVAVGMITVLLYRQLLSPISALNQGIGRIARREPVDLRPIGVRDDELGSLARMVEQTAHAVITHQQQLERLLAICHELQRIQTLEICASGQEKFLLKVLKQAVELTRARYGALGLFDKTGEQLTQFLTVGLDEATRAAIGTPPTGRGILALLAQEDKPLRLKDLAGHPDASGFPPQHPPMHSFLGQSIKLENRLYGRIYLTEKVEAEEFTEADALALSILATQAGIALETGQYIAEIRATEAALTISHQQLQAALDHTSAERTRHEETAHRLAAIVESAEDAIVSMTADGILQTWNRGAERLYGYAAAEIVGQSVVKLAPPEVQGEQQALLAQVTRGQIVSQKETIRLRQDGQRFIAALTLSPIVNATGTVSGITAIVRDMTEQKRTWEAWHHAKTLLENTFQNMSEVVFVVNPETRTMVRCNEAVRQVFGYAVDEVVGQNTAFLHLDAAKYEEFGQQLFPALNRGDGRCTLQFPMRRKNGETFLAEHTLSEIRDDSGRRTGVVNVIRDITEQVRLQERLHQAQKMEAIGRLAGGIAHDFNNVLTVIAGNNRLLREELPPGHPGHGLVEEIAQASDRAAQLTTQLLTFSRKQRVQPQRLDLSQTLPTIERLLRRLIGEDVTVGIVPGPPGSLIVVDPTQLEQVILNLGINARDAMPQGGRLTIEAGPVDIHDGEPCSHGTLPPGPYVRLRVTDTGVGMDAPTLAQCFEPFFTTKAHGKGTGLGLATVYGIVAEHHGVIDVTSQPTQGTCFTLYFPRAEEKWPHSFAQQPEVFK